MNGSGNGAHGRGGPVWDVQRAVKAVHDIVGAVLDVSVHLLLVGGRLKHVVVRALGCVALGFHVDRLQGRGRVRRGGRTRSVVVTDFAVFNHDDVGRGCFPAQQRPHPNVHLGRGWADVVTRWHWQRRKERARGREREREREREMESQNDRVRMTETE